MDKLELENRLKEAAQTGRTLRITFMLVAVARLDVFLGLVARGLVQIDKALVRVVGDALLDKDWKHSEDRVIDLTVTDAWNMGEFAHPLHMLIESAELLPSPS